MTDVPNEATKAAIKLFQEANGLKVDGDLTEDTEGAFMAYMDLLCVKDFILDKKEDFLAQGKDKDGKGDFQGAGSSTRW
jgi:peptidoglycan hydrolase-like protein with peptidoglycan-binding domain